jgi:LysR family transcriptional regulator for bpeEF and oprC
VAVNEAGAYLDCGLKGFGLIQVPRYMALPHLQSGELIEVLPQWKPSPTAISVLYPQSRQLSPKVRAFTDWVAELFAGCPLLSGRDETDPAAAHCGVYARSQGAQPATVGAAMPSPALPGMPPRRRSAREEAAEYAL